MDGLNGYFDDENGETYICTIVWRLLQILFYIYMSLFFILFMVEFNIFMEVKKILISVKELVLNYCNTILNYSIGLYISIRYPTITYTWPNGIKPT